MTQHYSTEITDARLLAAMKAANPTIEKLMGDRFALRQEVRCTAAKLEEVSRRADHFEMTLPHYIGIAKAVTLTAAGIALAALGTALFTQIFDIKISATLSASILLPLWLVNLAEQKFGIWRIRLRGLPTFHPRYHEC